MVKSISVKSIISRIRWNVVIPMIVFILLLIISLWIFNPFAQHYKCTDGICVKIHADPPKVLLQDESTIWVEIKNVGNSNKKLMVNMNSDDPSVIFTETGKQSCSDQIELAPGNSRNLDFSVVINAEYAGEYGIGSSVIFDDQKIEEKIFLNVVNG